MKTIILVAISIVALIFTMGSIGAYEQANIGFMQCLIQCAIGAGTEWLVLSKIEK